MSGLKKHGIRGLLILALIWALIGAAWAEEMLPASIREAQSAEEANALGQRFMDEINSLIN